MTPVTRVPEHLLVEFGFDPDSQAYGCVKATSLGEASPTRYYG